MDAAFGVGDIDIIIEVFCFILKATDFYWLDLKAHRFQKKKEFFSGQLR